LIINYHNYCIFHLFKVIASITFASVIAFSNKKIGVLNLTKNFIAKKSDLMSAQSHDHKPNLLVSILQNKCPRCRRGDMYQYKGAFRIKGLMKMNERCPVCGQPLNMEPGFYYGTNMTSYILAILVSIISFVLWILIIGVSLQDSRFFWWIGFNAVLLLALQPPIMRISRTVWLTFFVKYTPNWREGDIKEQFSVNKDQANNW
jgi:uncharacterized protein (DUF983 family)